MFKAPENLLILLIGGIWLTILLRRLIEDLRTRREAFASRLMLERIVGHQPTRRPVYKWILLIVAFASICIALARPVGGTYEQAIVGQGLDLVVALDVSQSMRAMDIEGHSRLEIAKALIERLMSGLRQDRVGLVVFAGDTMVQSPLTSDKNSFLTFLERSDPDLLTKQGTNLASAIETSIDRFDMTASQSRVIVLVSDGEDPDQKRLEKAVSEAKRKQIPVFTVGIGSRNGGPIPVGRTVWGDLVYKKWKGETVVSRLEDATLRDIAKKTGAQYFRAADGKSAQQVATALESLKRVAIVAGNQTAVHELYALPALLAFLLLLAEWMISERIPFEREQDHWLKRI